MASEIKLQVGSSLTAQPRFSLHDIAFHNRINYADLRAGLLEHGVAPSTVEAVMTSFMRRSDEGLIGIFFQYEGADSVNAAIKNLMIERCTRADGKGVMYEPATTD